MKLAADERRMLDGMEGPARQKAMDLLVRYGEALGAERLVDTNNVCATAGATTPFLRDFAAQHPGGLDAVFSEFSLDSAEVVKIPKVRTYTSHLQQGLDPAHAAEQSVAHELVQLYRKGEAYLGGLGLQMLNTCTPYQVGNVPVKGEHCAWMESSAVIYCNSVLGGRISGADPIHTSMTAARLGVVLYFIPIFFLFEPALILQGPLYRTAIWLTFNIVAIVIIAGASEGVLMGFGRLRTWARPVLFFAGLLIGFPEWESTAVGIGLVLLVLMLRRLSTAPGTTRG